MITTLWFLKNKTPVHIGTGGNPAVPPKLTVLRLRSGPVHSALTIISLPCNAGIAVQTTNVTLYGTPSPERLKRELRSGSAGWEFQPVLHTSLAAFADVLSSVVAFIMLGVLSAKSGMMSRANRLKTWQECYT